MASSSTSREVGYDVEIIEGYPSKLDCTICTMVIKRATYGCQRHTFCYTCIIKHVEVGIRDEKGNVICPGGCREVIDASNLQPNHFADQLINSLKIKCQNECCSWKGDLLDLVQDHEDQCDYKREGCNNNGCNEMIFQKDVELHKDSCSYGSIQCVYCGNTIIRINKDKHEVACLDEEIACEYHAIGCNIKFCRKDIGTHDINYQLQHMRLMYNNIKQQNIHLTNQITENKMKSDDRITKLEQQNIHLTNQITVNKMKSDDRITKLEEQNIHLTNQITVNKMKSDDRITKLEQQLKIIHNGLVDVKQENLQLKEEIKNFQSVIVKPKVEIKRSNRLNYLKEDIKKIPELTKKVSLLHNDTVVHVDVSAVGEFNIYKASKCYEKMQFDYMIGYLHLSNHKLILNELFNKVSNHLFEYKDQSYHSYEFYFPLDLNHIKDLDIVIPDKLKVTIINNEIVVQLPSVKWIDLFVGKYRIKLQNGVKFNLQQVDDSMLRGRIFANGYCCLVIYIK